MAATMKLGTQTGSIINHIYSASAGAVPEVGAGATILSWTDRYAGTIIEVRSPTDFTVQEDRAIRTDNRGMSEAQEYEYRANPAGRVWHFKAVSRGYAKGSLREGGRKDGCGVIVGVRRSYHDFSF